MHEYSVGPSEKNPLSILVIDDDPDHRDILARHLSATGHHVHQAENCPGAIDQISQLINKPPDVVIIDLYMPEVSGTDTLTQLLRIKKLQETAFVLTSAASVSDEIKQRFDSHLPKPFDLDSIEATLRSSVRHRRMVLNSYGSTDPVSKTPRA